MPVNKVSSSGSESPRIDADMKNGGYVSDVEPQTHLDSAAEVAYVVDHHAERALCRKFDFRLLPVLAIMYLFNALDKGNLGNAKTAHLEDNLGFKKNQYNIILSVFYVPYVLFAPVLVCLKISIRRFSCLTTTRVCLGRNMALREFYHL